MDSRTIGILGGGQLGRMMIEAGHRLGIKLAIVDPGGEQSPAGQLADISIEGSFSDEDKIRELASISDIITIEIEHVNVDILEVLEKEGVIIHPSPITIKIIQDKYQQKVHLAKNNIALPEFMNIPSLDIAYEAGNIYGYPYMLKNKRLAYDGRGNAVVKSASNVEEAFCKLGGDKNAELYAEKWAPFIKELAVMVIRTIDGNVISYPVVETVQKDNICHLVTAPAQINNSCAIEAEKIARNAIASLPGVGIYGVELFLLPDDSILLNEIAPRPHNSGHYTMEACEIDQFEMHLRAILGLPCPTPNFCVGAAMMVNILGLNSMEETKAPMISALNINSVGLHWYGKNENRKGRKMAHFTVTSKSFNELADKMDIIGIHEHGIKRSGVKVGIIMGSDSDLPTMQEAAKILDKFKITYELTIVSAHRTPTRMYSYAQSAAERGIQVIIAGAGGAAHLPGMVAALTSLPVIGVPIKTSTMNGLDSLYSIVQMPSGIPVATVAIGNASNAGLLAVRILGSSNPSLLIEMDNFMINQEEDVLKKAARLENIGYNSYLNPN